MEAFDTGYGILLGPTSLFFVLFFLLFFIISTLGHPDSDSFRPKPRLGAYSELQYPRDGITIGIPFAGSLWSRFLIWILWSTDIQDIFQLFIFSVLTHNYFTYLIRIPQKTEDALMTKAIPKKASGIRSRQIFKHSLARSHRLVVECIALCHTRG